MPQVDFRDDLMPLQQPEPDEILEALKRDREATSSLNRRFNRADRLASLLHRAAEFRCSGTDREFATRWSVLWLRAARGFKAFTEVGALAPLPADAPPGWKAARELFALAMPHCSSREFEERLFERMEQFQARPGVPDGHQWVSFRDYLKDLGSSIDAIATEIDGERPSPFAAPYRPAGQHRAPDSASVVEEKPVGSEPEGNLRPEDVVESPSVLKVLRALPAEKATILARQDVIRRLHSLTPTTIDRALKTLLEAGLAIRPTQGKYRRTRAGDQIVRETSQTGQ